MSGTDTSISPDLRELIRRVARFQHGLGFLHQADVDCIAVTLGVHPFVVAEARRRLETPEGRALVIEALRLARADRSGATGDEEPRTGGSPMREDRGTPWTTEKPTRPLERPARPTGKPPRPLGLRGLLRAARRHSLGLPFLMEAPFESVAVTFRVHPFVVLQARTLLARRESRRRNPGASEAS